MNLSRIARIQFAFEQGKLDRFKTGLKMGSTMNGKVLQAFGNDQYMVSLRGVNLIAQSDIPMKRGDRFKAEIREVQPRLILKILHAEDQGGRLAEKWGVKGEGRTLISEMVSARMPLSRDLYDRIHAAVRKFSRGGTHKATYEEICRAAVKLEKMNLPLTQANIARQIAAIRAEFNLAEIMVKLGEILSGEGGSLSQKSSDALNRIIAGFTPAAARNLPAVIMLMGLLHESNLKAFLGGGKPSKEVNLKMLLLMLQGTLSDGDELQRQGLEDLEAMQFRNLPENRSASGDTYYIQVPVCYDGNWENVDLFYHGEGGSKERIDKDNAAIRVNLDSKYLGKLSALAEIQNGALTVHFYFERKDIVDYIQPHLGQLQEALSDTGYDVRAISVSQWAEVDEMVGFTGGGEESLNMLV